MFWSCLLSMFFQIDTKFCCPHREWYLFPCTVSFHLLVILISCKTSPANLNSIGLPDEVETFCQQSGVVTTITKWEYQWSSLRYPATLPWRVHANVMFYIHWWKVFVNKVDLLSSIKYLSIICRNKNTSASLSGVVQKDTMLVMYFHP